jgi:hypothetical protein
VTATRLPSKTIQSPRKAITSGGAPSSSSGTGLSTALKISSPKWMRPDLRMCICGVSWCTAWNHQRRSNVCRLRWIQ